MRVFFCMQGGDQPEHSKVEQINDSSEGLCSTDRSRLVRREGHAIVVAEPAAPVADVFASSWRLTMAS